MKAHGYLFFLFLLLSFSAFSQTYSTTNKKAIKLYQEAELLLKQRNFDPAILDLQEAIDKDPNFVEALVKLANVYKLFGNPDNAKRLFIRAAEAKPDSKELAGVYFYIGEYYFTDGDYETAKKYFEKTIAYTSDKIALEKSNNYVAKCDFAVEAKKHPVPFNPVLMPAEINKYFVQDYPVLTADQQTLIYSIIRTDRKGDDEEIVVSYKVNGQWTAPVPISPNINTQYNEGACTLSSDGRTLIFTSDRPGSMGHTDFFISTRQGKEWSKPKSLGPAVNSTGWDSEPTLSADGRTLYFASDRKGGLGREDIWMSQQNEKGEWSQARNLGKPINTTGREVSPFIHSNGTTLYFSSDYFPGMGNFDVFTSHLKDSSWEEPKNLGYPINTSINEGTMFITTDSKKGYYSAYEKKNAGYNRALIYEFDVPKELQEPDLSTYAKGGVFDEDTKKPVKAKEELIDLKTNKVIQSTSSDSVDGSYVVVLTKGAEYALYVSADNYLFKSIFFDYKDPKSFDPLTLDVYLSPIKAGRSIVLNNIFFASNSYTLEEKSKTELDKIVQFLNNNPKLKIEFGGHTDDVGSDKDNLELSQKRAKAVYDYIVSKGIAAARLSYKGYGETKPVAPNDSEEHRQLNRRIEFKVL